MPSSNTNHKFTLIAFAPVVVTVLSLLSILVFAESEAFELPKLRFLAFGFMALGIGVGVLAFVIANQLRANVSRVSDLTERVSRDWNLHPHFPDLNNPQVKELSMHMAVILQAFSDTVSQVNSSNNRLDTYAKQLANETAEAQAVLTQQQQHVRDIQQATGQMTDSVIQISDRAGKASDMANTAQEETERGNQLVARTLSSINQLAQEVSNAREVIQRVDSDSKEIGSVLDVIKGIAEQTNLLALNAAIEAARAGEQGRGFAVVADEVRTLAQRTQQSTQEIQNMIERLQSGAAEAVRVMEEGTTRAQANVEEASKAGQSLTAIKEAIAEIGKANAEIAQSTGEQRELAEHVNRYLEQITQESERGYKSAQAALQAGQEVSSISDKLSETVIQFHEGAA